MSSQLNTLIERTERLLLRHEEVIRTNELLQDQLSDAKSECEMLKARLLAARLRIDALIDLIPQPSLSENSIT